MEFYQASLEKLKKQVFQSILGYYWYLRLRRHEIDAIDFKRKSFGNTYALGRQTNDPRELAKLLMKLCEKTGRRLRKAKYSAQGVHVSCVYTDLSWWHIGRKFDVPVYTTRDIYRRWREIRVCTDNACGESKGRNYHDSLLESHS